MTDPIADMLTRIRNALVVKHEEVEIPTSNMKKEIARILLEEGYINGYEVVGDKGETIKVALKYGIAIELKDGRELTYLEGSDKIVFVNGRYQVVLAGGEWLFAEF